MNEAIPATKKSAEIKSADTFDYLRQQVAEAHGIKLFYHYSEMEASKLLRLSVSTLKRARRSDSIGFIRKGQKGVAYFGFNLVDYLLADST